MTAAVDGARCWHASLTSVASISSIDARCRPFYLSVNRANPLPRNLDMSPEAMAAAPLLPLMLPLLTRATD